MAAEVLGQTWNISPKGEEIITENNTIKDRATILKNALNSDLKEIGSPVLAKLQNKTTISQVVLQIQKLRNISAPKANENSHAAPRMLKLVLTDGDSYIQAIETASVPSLNLEKTPPGSKLLIHYAKISSGYILLEADNCKLLGGHVPAMCEKWEVAKSVQQHNRQNASSDGPPAWVNFGCKLQSLQTDAHDRSFKSLDNKNAESKENSKFDMQRQDAIAEATSGAVKKVFGGGVKQAVQPPPQSKFKKNNFPIKDKKGKIKSINSNEVEDKPQKPPEKVSLFDFLENKLPSSDVEPPKPIINSNNNPRYISTTNYDYNNRSRNTYKPNEQQGNRYNNKPMYNQVKPQQPNVEVNGLANNLEKMSLNSQFASRSLKQHLNLGPQKKNPPEHSTNQVEWKVGDDCVAKYWEDGKFYNATITATTDKTCVVKFKGYGNIEEVLKTDCLPVLNNETKKAHYTGPMEFRRSGRTFRRQ